LRHFRQVFAHGDIDYWNSVIGNGRPMSKVLQDLRLECDLCCNHASKGLKAHLSLRPTGSLRRRQFEVHRCQGFQCRQKLPFRPSPRWAVQRNSRAACQTVTRETPSRSITSYSLPISCPEGIAKAGPWSVTDLIPGRSQRRNDARPVCARPSCCNAQPGLRAHDRQSRWH
jgi:hypothetical protein